MINRRKKGWLHLPAIVFAFGLMLSLSACSAQEAQDPEEILPVTDMAVSGEQEDNNGKNILIAYFTRLDNTDATLDEIVQGGGPYGSLGDSWESSDMDAIASASITLMDGEVKGNVEAMAQMIGSLTGGDLFSIRTVQKYPVNYDELINVGGEERRANARPELAAHVEDMGSYDIIFLGYPNWWNDMPMAVYSFLEEYDFSGKTIIPFAASAGSGFSRTISSIQEMLPGTAVLEDGLHIPMGEVSEGQGRIEEWIFGLEI